MCARVKPSSSLSFDLYVWEKKKKLLKTFNNVLHVGVLFCNARSAKYNFETREREIIERRLNDRCSLFLPLRRRRRRWLLLRRRHRRYRYSLADERRCFGQISPRF